MDQIEEKRVWGIHTQDDKLFLQDSVIAIGWREFGDLSVLNATREDFKQHYLDVYPDAKKGAVAKCYFS
jgi:restriction system protein